jgi:hypothetical protein
LLEPTRNSLPPKSPTVRLKHFTELLWTSRYLGKA